MTGAELEAAIVEAAHVFGWKVAHFAPARTDKGWRTPCRYDAKGWPDLVLVRERVMFVEVKGDGDKLRPDQEAWLEWLRSAGQAAYVWSPADWVAGRVEAALRHHAVAAA